jgi:hypothetical protein
VIDPLVFSTLVGGADEDYATAIDLDGNGNIYVSGWTYSTDFPVTSGAYQATSPSNFDLLVAKLDPTATGSAQLVSSTFIGGSTADGVIDMAIDATGKVYLTGFTDSDDYPTSAGALAATRGGNVDGFVTTIDLAATGASQLVYSTYLGGTDFEQSGGIAVDASGRIVVAGITASTDFPTTSDAISTAPSPGSYDATVTRLDPSASGSAQLEYSTLIGGSSYDIGYSVAVDGSSGIYLTGYTISTDFPTSSGAFATTLAGESDIFVTKLAAPDSNGMRIVYSTYLGGSGSDNEYGIALDATGRIYLAGWTNSTDFPTSANAYSSSNAGGTDAFVATIDPSASGNAQLAYGTYIGGGDEDFAYGVALDADGRIWFTGWTASTDYPTTADAYSATNSGGANDALVTKLDMTATGSAQLAYSTYIGGSGDDQPNGIAVDPNGRVFIAGYTTSSDYPTSSGAYSSTNNGGYDLFISELTFTSIDLTSFNGGSYCAGTSQNITWSSSGMTNVKIELSGDGGATYPTTIVASTAASAGSYAWSIPANQAVGSSYRIRISDASDPTTDNQSDADFTINAPTAITTQPQATVACIGSPVTMSVVATGTGLAYQWRKAGLPITGATSSSYTITSPTTASAGYYSVVVTGSCGTPVTSAQVFLTIRTPQVITQQPTGRTICQGANTTFTVTATGSSLTYQWRLNGTNIPGANSASYTIHNASSSNAGAYTVVVGGSCPISVTSNNAMLIVNPTTVLTYQPTSQSVCQYQPAYFSVGAAGTGVTFQWRYNGTNIAGATSPSYVAYNPGNYSVVVTGACGNPVTSNTVSMSWLPSTYISSQPGSPTVCENTYVTLWVGASGYGTLHYQWMKNGVIINGNDSPYLNLGPVSTFSAGTYRVNVSGGCGGATSNDAVVTVNPATRIISQPTGATRALGTSVTFSVSATGTGLSYQWKKNNAPINGATGSSYTINNVSFSSAATYSVVVTGQCGTVTSNGAVLTVTLLKPTEPSTGAEATAPAIAVTPNPASDAARIELTIPSALQGARTLKLYDESGGLVRDLTSALGDGGSQSMMLDVSDLPSGRYHVQLRIAGHDAVGATVVVVR